MTVEEFLANKPTKEEAIDMLCKMANNYVLEIDETFAWEELSLYAGVTKDDFYDDTEETIKEYGIESVTHYGIYNWKLKTKEMV